MMDGQMMKRKLKIAEIFELPIRGISSLEILREEADLDVLPYPLMYR
jgi:hypothetical protein